MKCEWKEVKLQDIAQELSDGLHKAPIFYPHGEYLFVNATNIENGRIVEKDSAKRTNLEEFLKYGVELTDRTILYSIDGTIGNIAKYRGEKCLLGKGACYITLDHNVDVDYIYYLLQSAIFSDYIHMMSTGSTIKHISLKTMRNFTFKLPPVAQQIAIGKVLRSFDDKIECNNKINENLQQQAQAIFKAWFIDDPRIAGWRMSTFSELIEKTISGDWGKQTATGNYTEMVYCIRGADIPEVRQGNKGKMPIRYILAKNYAAKKLVNGDLVVEISGGSPTQSTGRVAAISSALLNRYDKGMVCTNFCKALKPIDGYSMYIYHYWQYLYDKGVFFSYENGTTGIKNLDINGFLETEPIHIAPKELVEKFDTICQFIFSVVYANGLENERLAQLRDTLLPKLMNGEIDIDGI